MGKKDFDVGYLMCLVVGRFSVYIGLFWVKRILTLAICCVWPWGEFRLINEEIFRR